MPVKPFLSLEQQLELLKSRGLIIANEEYAKKVLANVNYYRFSAYSLTLREHDRFADAVTFEEVYYIYNFDARLRNFVFKYSAPIETNLRARMAYVHAKNHGALGYMDNSNFKDQWLHAQFLSKVRKLLDTSKEAFVLHHRNDLNGEYPFWVAVEVMTFDVASKCLQNMVVSDQTEIAKLYDVRTKFLVNWMKCAVIARNIAAHCGRFYNRPISIKPLIPNAVVADIRSDRAFAYLYVIYQLLSPEDKPVFIFDFKRLLSDYNEIDFDYIGLPQNWATVLSTKIKAENQQQEQNTQPE